MKWKILIQIGAVFGGLAVLFGAFGAHGLRDILSPSDMAIYETAVFYQFLHALALLFLGLLKERISTISNWPGWLFTVGIIVFSGSLYLLVLTQQRWLGAITPIGGVSFISAWLVLFWTVRSAK